MDYSYFKKPRILDGGMGQELLARGMESEGTLWSATALKEEKYHSLILDIYSDFIKAGSDVIVTANFTARKKRLEENGIGERLQELNQMAGQLAQKARKSAQAEDQVLIAGGLSPQNHTYQPDLRDEDEILDGFVGQAEALEPFVDFYYLDVMSSLRECQLGIKAAEQTSSAKPILLGLHFRKDGKLPSKESLAQVVEALSKTSGRNEKNKIIGVIGACISPEIMKDILSEFVEMKEKHDLPFGFKVNGFVNIPPNWNVYEIKDPQNPEVTLGQRHFSPEELAKWADEFRSTGATILGGCCEIRPHHIEAIHSLVKLSKVN